MRLEVALGRAWDRRRARDAIADGFREGERRV